MAFICANTRFTAEMRLQQSLIGIYETFQPFQ